MQLLILSVAYGPYALFHLLFQETPMIRYALPLVPPVAFLAVCGIAAAGARAVRTSAAAFAVVALLFTVAALAVPLSLAARPEVQMVGAQAIPRATTLAAEPALTDR